MSCAIQAQWDFVAIREQNYYVSQGSISGEFTNKLLSTFTALTTGDAVVNAFVAGTNVYENVHYMRVGQFTDDSSFGVVAGDIISDATGLRPARNFDESVEINIYSEPKGSMSNFTAPTGYPLSLSDIVSYRDALEALTDNCGTYDLIMIDSKNLLCGIIMRCSAKVVFSQIVPDPELKLSIERRISDPAFNFSVFDLSTLT